MIYIALSVVQSTLIFITFKLFERFRIDNWQAILVNYLVASMLSFLLGNVAANPEKVIHAGWLPYSVALGFLFIGTFILFALSSQKAGVAITSVTSKMSVVIPVIFGASLYGEKLGIARISGIAMALIAFYLVFKKDKKHIPGTKWVYLPMMVFLGNGFTDTAMKYTQHHHVGNDLIPFLMITFLTSMVISVAVITIRNAGNKIAIQWRGVAAGAFLGSINFGSTYFIFKALEVYDSAVVFPVANSAIVGLSALTGYFGFREKLSLLNWAGVALAIVSIIIIASA